MDLPGTPYLVDGALVTAALFIAVSGMWRGILRESFAALGLLAGYAVASSWAGAWSDPLADVVSSSEATSLLIIESALIIGGGALCTLMASRAMDFMPPDMAGRLGGGLVAASSWLVAISLVGSRAVEQVLGPSTVATIEDTVLLRRLVDRPDAVLLAYVLSGAVMLLIATQVQRRRRDDLPRAVLARPGGPRLTRRDGHALAPEAEKVEPPAVAAGVAGALGGTSAYAETIPMPVVRDLSRPGEYVPESAGRSAQATSDWMTMATPRPGHLTDRQCQTCRERVTTNDRFCPRCGEPVH